MRIITDKVFREIGECFGCEGSTRFCFLLLMARSRSLWKSPVPEGVEHARFSQSGKASFMPFGKKLRHATEYGH